MKKIFIFYGPRDEFGNYIPSNGISIDQIIKISDLPFKSLIDKLEDFPKECSVIGYSNSYSSLSESGEQNFASILNNVSDFVSYLYLQNPTKAIAENLKRYYDEDIIEIKYYDYPNMRKEYILEFKNNFDNYVIGQSNVRNDLLSVFYNLYKEKNNKKPIVLMFYGPSGVGKTETAKYIGKILGGEIFRKQLSMFQGNESIGYLFGGTHNGASFSKDILERKSNIILLDEFDKANPVFHSAFYQMFDEVEYEDKNYKVDLSNCIIICTSNYENANDIRCRVGDPLFYRFDKIIKFSSLDKNAKKLIIDKIVDEEYDKLDEIERDVIDIINLKIYYYQYIDSFQNYRHTQSLIRDDINKKLVSTFI